MLHMEPRLNVSCSLLYGFYGLGKEGHHGGGNVFFEERLPRRNGNDNLASLKICGTTIRGVKIRICATIMYRLRRASSNYNVYKFGS